MANDMELAELAELEARAERNTTGRECDSRLQKRQRIQLTGTRSLLWVIDQSVSNRILEQVLPFFFVASIRAK